LRHDDVRAHARANAWYAHDELDALYSVTDELPIFLLVFAVPATVGAVVWWKLS